ncbi:DMT family transporter [uncultured Selenomonas sp.]|uniref:DMT family transporter n=1 Tax=uncultured Selenomonas sp. TaxID=159275 RepID=UPI0025F99A5E|nr:EamA family transporter [uncultured Selenomonas sp.]
MKHIPTPGAFCVAAAGILWGIIGLFVRALGDAQLTSMDIVAARAIVAAGLLFVLLAIFDRKSLHLRLRDVWCFLGTGIASIVFFNYCYFSAVQMMSLASAAVLMYTAPAFVMVLARACFGEAFTRRKLLSLVLTFFGCVLVTGVVGSDTPLSFAGILFGLGSGLGYGLYTIFGKFAMARGYSAPAITFYTFLVAAIAASVLNGTSRIIVAAQSSAFPYMLGLGALSTVLPFLLYTLGLRTLSGSRASILASIEPVTAAILGIAAYGETMQPMTLAGIVLVLVGIGVGSKAS